MCIPQCPPPVALPPLGAESGVLSLWGRGGRGGDPSARRLLSAPGTRRQRPGVSSLCGGVYPLGHVCVKDLELSVRSSGEQRPLWGRGEWSGSPTRFFRAQVLE